MLEYTGWDTMAVLNQRQEKIERDRQRAAADKALRDHFAAAALTGLLAQGDDGSFSEESYVRGAYRWADAMLREREPANLDAAPEATANAESVAPQPTAGDRAGNPPSHSGTGDTQEIAAYRQFVGEVMNWISEATGFLHDDVLRTDDARDIITDACSRCWDAFDRIAPTDHGASPEARASVGRPRTDKADLPTRAGTGDTPDSPKPIKGGVSDRSKPINGPDPDSRVWETHTPATHATRGEGSEQRECTEPVAWGVFRSDGEVAVIAFKRQDAEARATASDRIVPLYRHPPCQDISQKNLTLTDAEREAVKRAVDSIASTMPYESQQGLADWKTLRGLLERLGGGR